MSLSVAIIAKDEEKVISKCLESVKSIADEIIVVDTGSKDRTKNIALEYTDKVYDYKWKNDFSDARNFSFEKCTKEWILWIDCDDIILPIDQEKIKNLDFTDKEIIICKYCYSHDEFGVVECVVERERIIKRSLGLKWQKSIHEYLPLNGKCSREDIEIHHYKKSGSSERNLAILKEIIKKDLDPRNFYYLGKELADFGKLEEAIENLKIFVKKNGWWEDIFIAYQIISKCYLALKNEEEFFKNIFKSIQIEPRRAEPHYDLAEFYINKNDWKKAIHYFEICLNIKRPKDLMSTYYPQYYTWKPALSLCVCYNNIGDIKKSYEYNELFLKYRPNDSRGHNNRAILYPFIYPIKNNTKEIKNNIKEIKIAWIAPYNLEAAQTRIRVINVNKMLNSMGYLSNLEEDYIEIINKNYNIVIVGKSFNEQQLKNIKILKEHKKIIFCDLCEDICGWLYVNEIIEICDLIICCSYELEKKVKFINSKTVVIEDAFEI